MIHGKAVEWESLEFKRGWNPEEIVHTICAFANDLNNWGGGYVIVGIDENKGQALLPPHGIEENQIDSIQGHIVQLAHQISPNYFPITQPYVLHEKHILVLWCSNFSLISVFCQTNPISCDGITFNSCTYNLQCNFINT